MGSIAWLCNISMCYKIFLAIPSSIPCKLIMFSIAGITGKWLKCTVKKTLLLARRYYLAFGINLQRASSWNLLQHLLWLPLVLLNHCFKQDTFSCRDWFLSVVTGLTFLVLKMYNLEFISISLIENFSFLCQISIIEHPWKIGFEITENNTSEYLSSYEESIQSARKMHLRVLDTEG